MSEHKALLQHYLQPQRDAMLWKLDGLTSRQMRWPYTDTGTNLLGLVKHLASMEFAYFGDVFDRHGDDLPWLDSAAPPNADMWATAAESSEWVIDFYRRSWAHADSTIAALNLDSVGHVPWWGANATPTLRRILVHMITETARHTGHADIIRELIDGEVGMGQEHSNLPEGDASWWRDYRNELQEVAKTAG